MRINLAVLTFSCVVLSQAPYAYYVRACPAVADYSSGHIYPLKIHGVVYLTLVQQRMLVVSEALVIALFIGCGLLYRKQRRRRRSGEALLALESASSSFDLPK